MSANRNLAALANSANTTGYMATANLAGTFLPSTISYAGGVVYENDRTISSNYTMTAGRSGHTAGPITLSTGVSVTLPTGCRMIIL